MAFLLAAQVLETAADCACRIEFVFDADLMDNVVKRKRFLGSVDGRKEHETEIQSNGQCSGFSPAADWMRFYNDIESKGFIQFQQY